MDVQLIWVSQKAENTTMQNVTKKTKNQKTLTYVMVKCI